MSQPDLESSPCFVSCQTVTCLSHVSSTCTLCFGSPALRRGHGFYAFCTCCFFCLKYTFLLCPEKSYSFFRLQFKHLFLYEAFFYPLQPQKIWLHPSVLHSYAHPDFHYRSYHTELWLFIFTSIPWPVPLPYHLLQTPEDGEKNLFHVCVST